MRRGCLERSGVSVDQGQDDLRTEVRLQIHPGAPFVPALDLSLIEFDDLPRLVAVLRLADRGATVTFWVYSDSFDAYRQLQPAARTLNLDVAARPLPEGVPIAGSPEGSRSSSQ